MEKPQEVKGARSHLGHVQQVDHQFRLDLGLC